MVLLLDAGSLRSFSLGVLPASGEQTVVAARPTESSIIGQGFPAQILSVDPGFTAFRFGNLRDVVFLP